MQSTIKATNYETNHSYLVRFATIDQAVSFMNIRSSTHYFSAVNVPDDANDIWDILDPSCEHGLSLSLCSGPGHYPQDNYY